MAGRIAILGATGSIGRNAVDVVEHLRGAGGEFSVTAISGFSRLGELLEIARRVRPAAVGLAGEGDAGVERELAGLGCEIYRGARGLVEMVGRGDVDCVVGAMVGSAGVGPVMAAVEGRKRVALANKETLVMGGAAMMRRVRELGGSLIPVDSEHSAVFQAMQCGRLGEVRRVILTASGGPFRTASVEKMEHATVAEALAHPTWRMGSKISIDSATMFNKALEIIEACWLFDLPGEKVEVVVHPESVVHSMVEFVDGSVVGQMSPPDMRGAIQYAITYPERRGGMGKRLSFEGGMNLRFEKPDFGKFPALRLAYEAVKAGGGMGAVLNAANEAAVGAFLAGGISLGGIARVVEMTMRAFGERGERCGDGLEMRALLEADGWARGFVGGVIERGGGGG